MLRRDLFKSAAAGAGLTILKSGMLRGQTAPSNKLNIALIGVWGRGTAHYNVLRNENVVALCDVNDRRTKEALDIFPKAKTYWDWRRLLDQKDVEAVIFAPVALIFRVKTEQEAIKLANDSPYGLGGSVITKDIERGKRVARQIETGMVFINQSTWTAPELPFGGVKNSGYGCELSDLGISEFVNKKLIRVA